MSGDHHHQHDAAQARCLVIVVSDSRTLQTDEGGRLITEFLEKASHEVVSRVIVPDEPEAICEAVLRATDGDEALDAVILTGGTGVTARDLTPEAVGPLFERPLPGFGEAFRRLSFAQIGARAILSRATAGTRKRSLIFLLPGSAKACALATEELILPLLSHGVAMVRG